MLEIPHEFPLFVNASNEVLGFSGAGFFSTSVSYMPGSLSGSRDPDAPLLVGVGVGAGVGVGVEVGSDVGVCADSVTDGDGNTLSHEDAVP